ncbi:hypothetical protein D2V04_15360 [Pelagerythrobacter aerophilus]|uniref:Uncharacterized protein n=1 Tax=Pelagerythrobacter aerophilus TaxID=2306995 RepID=A0A418NEK3_9SPHN|nr:hypothetical protein D2V04_15360 [Pelagerythrobacter aerophilus]
MLLEPGSRSMILSIRTPAGRYVLRHGDYSLAPYYRQEAKTLLALAPFWSEAEWQLLQRIADGGQVTRREAKGFWDCKAYFASLSRGGAA